jgi:hypothetical protein
MERGDKPTFIPTARYGSNPVASQVLLVRVETTQPNLTNIIEAKAAMGFHRTRLLILSSIAPKHLSDLGGVVSHISLVEDDAIRPFDL